MIVPAFTPAQQAKRKLIEDSVREASKLFVPGSDRHTIETLRLICGGEARTMQRPFVGLAEALKRAAR